MFKKIKNVFKKRTESVQRNCPNAQSNGADEFHDDIPHYCHPTSTETYQQSGGSCNAHPQTFHYIPIELMGSSSNARIEYPNIKDQKRSATQDPVLAPGCPPGGICPDDQGMRYPQRRGENFRRDPRTDHQMPSEVRHDRVPDHVPADTKYDQAPSDSRYNQSPCDPYAVSPRSWLRHSPQDRRPLFQDRGPGFTAPDACNDESELCRSESNRRGVFPSSSRSKGRAARVGTDVRTNPLSFIPTDRNLLDEVAEFYHQFPDLHTEVRIMVANNVTIYMLGTNHADPQCPIDVSNIVRRIRPQAVLIELCAWRACGCKDHVGNIFQTKPEFNFRYLRKVISQIGFLPAMIFFTDAFNEHNASERGRRLMDYGAEFAVAAQACKELTDCKIVLADREIPITVKRQASAMGNWRGLKMTMLVTLSLLFRRRMKKYLLRGHRLVIRDPHFYQIVVLERDIFLTYMIQAAASLPYKHTRPKIVAVVGQGHLNGIQSYWGRVVPQVLPLILKSDIDM